MPHVLPAALIALTVVAGFIDAASYLGLSHVFVANMTGNVFFVGFAPGGVHTIDLAASLAALGAFLAGAAGGGRLTLRLAARGSRWPAGSIGTQTLCVAHVRGPSWFIVVALLAVAMGLQNVPAGRLNVADLTTTVLTQTLMRLAIESRIAGGAGIGRDGGSPPSRPCWAARSSAPCSSSVPASPWRCSPAPRSSAS